MEKIWENYLLPIGNESFIERIKKLKDIFNTGITECIFFEILYNLHNGSYAYIPINKKLTIDEWEEDLKKSVPTIKKNQLILLFDYLTTFYSDILRIEKTHNNELFRLCKSPNDYKDLFKIEFIVLKTLEILD